jgi:6-pyruvoyl-tetrahydropterin synthase
MAGIAQSVQSEWLQAEWQVEAEFFSVHSIKYLNACERLHAYEYIYSIYMTGLYEGVFIYVCMDVWRNSIPSKIHKTDMRIPIT